MSKTKRPYKYFIRDKSLEPAKSGYRTICEVQRQSLRLVEGELMAKEPEIAARLVALIEETYDLGKRMDRRLREHDGSYIQAVYEQV